MFGRIFVVAAILLGTSASALAQLPEPMSKLLRDAGIPDDAVGAVVLRGNSVLLAHNAERSMLPASTMKLVTSMVALDQLGPIFRGRTELRTNAELAGGVLNGNLVLRGGADADFSEDVLTHMLQTLRSQGIQSIRGDLIVDRQLFQPARADLLNPPFDETPEFRYNVVPDAALLNTNMLHIDITATDKRLKLNMLPALDNVSVSADMTLTNGSCAAWESGWKPPEAVRLEGGKLQVILHGSFPRNCSAATSINVLDRKDYADRLFRSIWRSLGGGFSGEVREAASASPGGGEAEIGTRLLADHVARALPEVLRDMNKSSDNTLARLVYLSIGGLEMDPMFGSHPAVVSTTETTAQRTDRLIRAWFAAHRIDDQGLVLDNGSGLSRFERIRPSQMAAVLQAATLSPWAPEFLSSLPIAGLDGTMRRRLRGSPAASRARIKTGTLNNVVAIAGFVPDANGQLCIVVAMINQDTVGRGPGGRGALDALIDWVATAAPVGM